MPKIIVDPESTSLAERFALVRTARRRGRFPAGCVTEVADAARPWPAPMPRGRSTRRRVRPVHLLRGPADLLPLRWLD